MKRRVVITGYGVVSPVGIGKDNFSNSLQLGSSGLSATQLFNPEHVPSKVSGQVLDIDFSTILPSRQVKNVWRIVPMSLIAAKEALDDAGLLDASDSIKEKISVLIGSGAHGIGYFENQFKKYMEKGFKAVSPHAITSTFVGMTASEISMYFGLKGYSTVMSNGCTSANDAMGFAMNSIKSGQTDIVVTGGAESCITEGVVASFCRLGALSTQYNDDPVSASRPFDKDRGGFVMGEGAWIFVFEELNHAKERGATIYGEISGYGATCDAYHRTSPSPHGEDLARAMGMAIDDAHLDKKDIDYIIAHGTSTQMNDSCETTSIKCCFGSKSYEIPISSLKSMMGHPQGACGGMSLAGALSSIRDGFLSPTINYETPDESCDLDYTPNKAKVASPDNILINSVAFGSKNSTIVVQKYKD
ncbi:beta-ketoacyl-[acyl-carrier-protein] synthase family protein [bacterium]|jgi:3-oxoacyl-[acyl-carrier-protein] synthase II|nr:beta-ketoacyl-[acyl-carrier-protein] synthase family protein [bacterium]